MKDADIVEENLSHEEKLKRLGIFSLRRRRLGGEMIEVFKTIHGIEKVNLGKLFCINGDGRTRKHKLKYWIEFFN